MRVVLATANPGKQREFAALLAPVHIELLLQATLAIPSVAETGDTFEANALLKARHASKCSGLPALADDSGIEVDALGGRPGVYSARYAGEHATDEDNNMRLLSELSAFAENKRQARYRCVLAMVHSATDPQPLVVNGIWEGRIASAPIGSGGFGYDPVFIPSGLNMTAAQIDAKLKNQISHRGAALRELLQKLTTWL